MLRRWLLIFLLFMLSAICFAQPGQNPDTVHIYRRIQEFSQKNRFLYMLYASVFRPVNPHPEPLSSHSVHAEIKPTYYRQFEGKYIRSIRIQTFDPFGYDPRDTTTTPLSFFQKAGNYTHVKTLPFKVKNLLQMKKNDIFDSLKVKESERLIRSQSSVREVFVIPSMTNSDSVDIHIRVYDVWSIIVTGVFSTTNGVLNIRDKNFLGLGHQFSNRYAQNFEGKYAYETSYFVNNISNTFINATMSYAIEENKNYRQGISIDRPFYSVLTRYAFGASLHQQVTRVEMLTIEDSTAFLQKFVSNTQDYWFGRSWQLVRGKSEAERTQSLISSVRYYRMHYKERAPEGYDTLLHRANEDFFLYTIGIAKRNYKQDNYIFNYGFTEDVPTGKAFSVIAGYQIKDSLRRWYLGSKIYLANYHPWGYFNTYVEYGGFINKSNLQEGNITAGINYFSNLLRIGRWKIRQFIKPQITLGIRRTRSDNLSLNNGAGIMGFNSEGLKGTQKAVFTFQLQSYAPWNVIGFRFGPFLVASFGMLGSELHGFKRAPVFSAIGIGVLIKNEYLVMNTFQMSIAFYPRIPGVGEYITKTNPIKTSDFGFRGFDITRPYPVSYY